MSVETIEWLNQNILVGYEDKRGKAWHYKQSAQGAEPNHYTGAVPIEDITRRLFNFQLIEGSITATAMGPNGVVTTADPDRKAIMHSGTGDILGIFKGGYQIHQYEEWLLQQVAHLLDDTLQIGSAGLLARGGVAWVSVEVPENIVTPSGVVFRPHLLAATSADGSLSTTYQRVVTNVVCDNTMSAALAEKDQRIKVRHSRYSHLKLADARAALEIVHSIGDDFAAQVEQLTNTTVTDVMFARFLDSLVPMTDDKGTTKTGRGLTMATNKQDKLREMYANDNRVAPWAGTAWGVVQLVNTFEHHAGTVKGATRADRNQLRAVKGEAAKVDVATMAALNEVLAAA